MPFGVSFLKLLFNYSLNVSFKYNKNYSLMDCVYNIIMCISGVRSGHASHALHDQIFRDCMMNFCAMRYRFFNLMRNGTGLK